MMFSNGYDDWNTTDGGPEGQITPQGAEGHPAAWLGGFGAEGGQLPAEAMEDGAPDDAAAPTDGGVALGLLFARDKAWVPSSAALSIPGAGVGLFFPKMGWFFP